MHSKLTCILVCIAGLATSHAASAVFLTERIVTGGGAATVYAAFAGNTNNKLYVVEQGGTIRQFDLSTSTPTSSVFLTLSTSNTPDGAKFATSGGEAGLLGLAFHPDFANNGYFYVNSTRYESGTSGRIYTDVTRYKVDNSGVAGNPTTVLRAFRLSGVTSTNHNAGWIGFGNDGYLYINTGDGGSSSGTAQDLNSNLGKVLRVDVNNDAFLADPTRNYAIPSGNPYAGVAGNDEIWASGLRNPFRAGFDSASGSLFIGDVGAGSREELNRANAAGRNFGWATCEGTCSTPGFTNPIYEYQTGGPMGRSIVGGPVYRGAIMDPELQGRVVFGDFFSGGFSATGDGKVWTVNPDGTGFMDITGLLNQSGWTGAQRINRISGFFEDSAHNLYIVDYDGDIFKLSAASVPIPGAVLLLASGLLGLGFLPRRRSRSQ